jgi:hypothetical protein
VWLHYDYLAPDPDGNSFAPNPAAIQLIVDAYARHGIQLEVDNQHNVLPWNDGHISLRQGCDFLTTNVYKARAQYFHPTSNHEWHYALFGNRIDDCQYDNETGEAELPGDNFVIAQGLLNYWYRYGPDWGNREVGGAVMHELGHNLGLRHGGGDDNNWKPNYLSVMNYRFMGGIPYAATPGSSVIVGARLDYSDAALPTLDEAHLDETLGVQGRPTDTDVTTWTAQETCPTCGSYGLGPTYGPLDWNMDGSATDRDVAIDLNKDPASSDAGGFFYIPLTGFDDWAAIRAYLLGTRDPGPKTIETDGESQEPVVTSISPAFGSANGGTIVTITGTHLNKATEVLFGGVDGGVYGPPIVVESAQFTIVNDTTITAVAPTLPTTTPGGAPLSIPSYGYQANVTVISGDTPSPSVLDDEFTYFPPGDGPVPVITSVSPSSGPFSGGTTVLIKGSGFYGTSEVKFICWTVAPYYFQAASFKVLDDSTISAVTPSVISGAAGPPTATADMLINPTWGQGSALTPADHFTFYLVPPPVITSVSPASGPATGGTTVVIKGSSFTGATAVSIGAGTTASFTVIDDSTISAVTPNVLGANGQPEFGTVDVHVTTPGGTSAITSFDQFTYLAPAGTPTPTSSPTSTPLPSPPPTLSGFTPPSGPVGALITLSGTNLTTGGGATVLFTGCSAASAVPAAPQADGTLTLTVPACATTGPLTVITAGGSSLSAQSFTVG